MSRLTLSEIFMLEFNELRNACNGNPQLLISFFRDKPDLVRLACAVKRTSDRIDSIGDLRKVHAHVPAQFISDWREYHDEWLRPVKYLNYIDAHEMLLGFFPESIDNDVESYEDWSKAKRLERWNAPDPDEEEAFDPSRHDGSAAFIDMMLLADHEREINRSMDNDEDNYRMANTWAIGIGAMDFLEESIGISVGDAFRRWNKVPALFVPKHVSNRHGIIEKGSLFELLNDAIRAYVAGSPAAAIAMCRAALEMVLRENYLGIPPSKKHGLEEVISLAAARFEHLEKSRLYPLKNRADKVLHDYTGLPRLSADDDQIILQFILEVKRCIEMAPEKN